MRKSDDVVQFMCFGVGSESRPAYMSMSREQYLRVMPPVLSAEATLLEEGNLDEACYENGHTWSDGHPYLGDLANGVQGVCLVCGCKAIRTWSK